MQRIRCVGAVIRDHDDRLLLVRRGTPPGAGLWSIPGGRVEPGESDGAAVAREVLEETGIAVEVGAYLGRVERPAGTPAGTTVYEIHDYAARPTGGPTQPRAGDDAAAARWVAIDALAALPCVPGLLEALDSWGCLGPAPDGPASDGPAPDRPAGP